MTDKPLTGQQKKVLGFVSEFVRRNGFPPTLREIGAAIQLGNVNAVRGHLSALEKKGYITKMPDKARSIQIVERPPVYQRVERELHEVMENDAGVLHRVVYGLAWTTWLRTPWLTSPRDELMAEAFAAAALAHGWTLLERRIHPDHVVVVVETRPNQSAHQTVHRLQAAGDAVKRRYPEPFGGPFLWGSGYAATTDLTRLNEMVNKLMQSP